MYWQCEEDLRSSFPTVSFICNVGSKVMAENENVAKERERKLYGMMIRWYDKQEI